LNFDITALDPGELPTKLPAIPLAIPNPAPIACAVALSALPLAIPCPIP